jgi:hypothetical protein
MSGPRDDGGMRVMVAAVLTMSAAQLFDLATFVSMTQRLGPHAEANPLVGLLFASYGYPLVAIVKVVLLAVVSAVGAILFGRSARPKLAAVVVAIAIVIGLVGGLSNSAAIGALPVV